MRFIDLFKALIFGIVEGVTEWLPISSTGHLIILNELVSLGSTDEFRELFFVAIQLGAILAVPVVSFRFKRNANFNLRILKLIAVGVIPAAIAGFLFDDFLDKFLYNYTVVSAMLILYGVVFVCISNKNKGRKVKIKNIEDMGDGEAFLVGLFQMLSLIPGTSRSGATFLGGYAIGASRSVSAEFSFLMAIPIMLGATLLKGAKLAFSGYILNGEECVLLFVGAISAFIVSVVTIKFLVDFVKKRSLLLFGIYRIILGFAVVIFFIFR